MNEGAFARKELSASTAAKDERNAACGGLCIGELNDAFEREADRVADEIMSGRAAKHHWSISSIPIGAQVHTNCSCEGSGGSTGECEEYKERAGEKMLQPKAVTS